MLYHGNKKRWGGNKIVFQEFSVFRKIKLISFHRGTSFPFRRAKSLPRLKQLQITKLSGPLQPFWHCCAAVSETKSSTEGRQLA